MNRETVSIEYILSKKSCCCLAVLLSAATLLLAGCDPAADSQPAEETASAESFVTVDGYRIPTLPSAPLQLSYGRSSFEDLREKDAALKAVSQHHPGERLYGGLAALERAYLSLGADYRLATGKQKAVAKEKYLEVLDSYHDSPEISAKALWYLGWISCDLFDDPKSGINYYLTLLNSYPEEQLRLLPAAPWRSIYLDESGQDPLMSYPRSAMSWADIARLEIIRHSPDGELAWHAFLAIRDRNPSGLLTGQGLKLLADRRGMGEKSGPLIEQYLEAGPAETALKEDLRQLLASYLQQKNRHKEQEPSPPEGRAQP